MLDIGGGALPGPPSAIASPRAATSTGNNNKDGDEKTLYAMGLTSSSSATPADNEHGCEFSVRSHLKARKQAGQVLAGAPG